ncbi:hypothetical protein BKA81DRAFT_402685 [Phyllosticta paracitricarpa]|uniref:Uncharacterized protein n=2 Tax=Phyllosticta TaxID=121621 RepID=A0ABR1MJT9_9PEZI
MSDYGYDSDDLEFFDDDAWLYIAEEDQLADDLAEGAVPDPPYLDDQLDDVGASSDPYEYWIDIEYNSDGWNDVQGKPKIRQLTTTGNKRRKTAQGGSPQKKRKVAQDATGRIAFNSLDAPPVKWIPASQRMEKVLGLDLPLAEPKESFALLEDWQTRFVSNTSPKMDAVGGEDDWATDSEDDSKPSRHTEACGGVGGARGHDWEGLVAGNGLDPQALMRALQENLSAAGAAPAGLDQNSLLNYALRMLNGDEEADDIAGEMADEMFEADDDSEGHEVAEWVEKQKASTTKNGHDTEAANEADHAASQSKQEDLRPTASSAQGEPQHPPSDPQNTKTAASSVGTAVTAGPSGASRKRKADEPEPDAAAPPPTKAKRAMHAYEATTASSRARSSKAGKASGKGKK